MLDIQQYLLTHSFNDLAKDHGIYPGFGKKDKRDNIKFSLNYDQIESKNSNPLTHECRGLILRRVQDKNIESLDEVIGTTVVVARPFKRFFNYGQPEAALKSLEGSDVLIMEKKDGCFLRESPLNCWDGSTVKIGDVVKNKLTPTLIGMDEQGKLVPCQIKMTNHCWLWLVCTKNLF